MKLEIAPLGNIEIFSIGVGEVGKGLQFSVGQRMTISGKQIVITDIVRDESSFGMFNEITYMIFATATWTDGGIVKQEDNVMIKAFVNQPVYISTRI